MTEPGTMTEDEAARFDAEFAMISLELRGLLGRLDELFGIASRE